MPVPASTYASRSLVLSLVVGFMTACPGDDTSVTTDPTTNPTTSTTNASITTFGSDETGSTGQPPGTGDGGSTGVVDDSGSGGSSESSGGIPACGNGVVEGDEQCDGAGETADCNADCTTASCGDSVVNTSAGEVCDEGGKTATCNADCTSAACGDGIINMESGETCDDGGESPGCDADCTFAECGDGVLNMNAGEGCDDGGESMTCDLDCTSAGCGDGVINMTAGETCDDSGESMTCNLDCTSAMCGDGIENQTAGETCDDGGDSMACDGDCTAVECGDGYTNMVIEECDDGAESAACDADCTMAFCGDLYVNVVAGESCDDGNMDPTDGCDACVADTPPSCQFVNGFNWCFNPLACGESCNEVCASFGLLPAADLTAWLEAQNEQAECDAIAAAFGIMSTSMGSYTYACLEDGGGDHSMAVLNEPLYCSTYVDCPTEHLTSSDEYGMDCNAVNSFRSICPCE